jgi:hypothetical protein
VFDVIFRGFEVVGAIIAVGMVLSLWLGVVIVTVIEGLRILRGIREDREFKNLTTRNKENRNEDE